MKSNQFTATFFGGILLFSGAMLTPTFPKAIGMGGDPGDPGQQGGETITIHVGGYVKVMTPDIGIKPAANVYLHLRVENAQGRAVKMYSPKTDIMGGISEFLDIPWGEGYRVRIVSLSGDLLDPKLDPEKGKYRYYRRYTFEKQIFKDLKRNPVVYVEDGSNYALVKSKSAGFNQTEPALMIINENG